jgi:hypothetical protein
MVTGAEGLHNQRDQIMTVVILSQPNHSAAWSVLPGTYQTFQDAREMVEFIHSSYGPDVFFAIEHSYDISRKGYVIAA